MIQNDTKILAHVSKRPVLIDVGARGGLGLEWDRLAREGLVTAYGFEPDTHHCDELQLRDPHVRYMSVALSNEKGRRSLFVARKANCSSLLRPDDKMLAGYPVRRIFEIVDETRVDVDTIDNLVLTGQIESPTYLKIDTQGSELDVLRGASSCINDIVGIELEARFKPIYRGESIFEEIRVYLDTAGFILREVRPTGVFEGELLEVDAFFSRRPRLDDSLELLVLWQAACCLSPAKFLADMGDWDPTYLEYVTEEDRKLRRACPGGNMTTRGEGR